MWSGIECDFVEDTERGPYCCFSQTVCHIENCMIKKNGLGKQDIEQSYEALYEIKSDMNK